MEWRPRWPLPYSRYRIVCKLVDFSSILFCSTSFQTSLVIGDLSRLLPEHFEVYLTLLAQGVILTNICNSEGSVSIQKLWQ